MKVMNLIAVMFLTGTVAMAQGGLRPKAGNFKVTSAPMSVTTTTSSSETPLDETVYTGIKGTVHVSTECGTYIEVSEKGVPAKYYPLNLPSEFDKDGANIVFDYIEEAGKYPANCGYSKAVTVNNVKMQKLR